MIPNEVNEGWHYLAVKKLSVLLHGITSKHDFYKWFFLVWIVFVLLEQKINLNVMKKYVEIKIFVEL